MQSNLEFLAYVRSCTNQVVTLRPWETVIKASADDDKVALLIETWRYVEFAREVKFQKRGQKLISFMLKEGVWTYAGEVTVWDETFVPFTHVKFGKSVSPREYEEQRQWERQTYRPGTAKNPLDNYERVLAGTTTDAMERYW